MIAQPDPRGTSHEKASSLTMAEDAPSEGYLPSPTVPPSEMTLQKDVNDIESPKFRLYKRRFLGVSGLVRHLFFTPSTRTEVSGYSSF
jgi:hypothetical protein